MIKKIFIQITMSIILLLIVGINNNAYAANDVTSEQLGFNISEDRYGQFGYIIEKSYKNYYSSKTVGVTTYSYVYCRAKTKALGKNVDLCCVRILTEPSQIKLTEKFLFFSSTKSYKFGISSLRFASDKSNYSNFYVNHIDYMTSADSATKEYSTDGSLSLSIGGVGINKSVVETISRSVVDVVDASTRTKTDLKFVFGSPSTKEQEERVYEQTYYYIMQEFLSTRSYYDNITVITTKYACGGKSSTLEYTLTTDIEY